MVRFFLYYSSSMAQETTKRRRTWTNDQLKAAIEACMSGEIGYLKAQTTFGVPRGTLHRFIKLKKSNPNLDFDDLLGIKLGRKPVFSLQLEKELTSYCLEMERRFFGLTKSDVLRIAYQLAESYGVSAPFNKESKTAGRKWFNNFLRRNPDISLRTPEATSIGTVKGFNRKSVSECFHILKTAFEKNHFPDNRVFNCDETGVTIVQGKQVKIVAKKGKKQIGALSSAERGSLVTVVTCMSAGGSYVPPLIIFPRKRMKNELMDGAPPGSIFAFHKSGWIQMDMFTTWFKHFINYVKPSAEDPVLLVLDGHFSHTRNLDVVLLARDSFVTIVCLPPHCSLDVSFMRLFKTYYNEEVRTWLANHRNPVRPITHYQISSLIGKAFAKAATLETAMNGFRKTGIYPLDLKTMTLLKNPRNWNNLKCLQTLQMTYCCYKIFVLFPDMKPTRLTSLVDKKKAKLKF
jgi:hypothetical protein